MQGARPPTLVMSFDNVPLTIRRPNGRSSYPRASITDILACGALRPPCWDVGWPASAAEKNAGGPAPQGGLGARSRKIKGGSVAPP